MNVENEPVEDEVQEDYENEDYEDEEDEDIPLLVDIEDLEFFQDLDLDDNEDVGYALFEYLIHEIRVVRDMLVDSMERDGVVGAQDEEDTMVEVGDD
jgi:hypothetical protein